VQLLQGRGLPVAVGNQSLGPLQQLVVRARVLLLVSQLLLQPWPDAVEWCTQLPSRGLLLLQLLLWKLPVLSGRSILLLPLLLR
jgi:hypothetical protein